MTKVYSQPTKLKVLSILGIFFFNAILLLIFLEIIENKHTLIENIYYLLSCFSICISINYVLIEQLKEKVTITDESFTLTTLFKKKSILKKEIKGYQLKDKNIFLIPINEQIKGISFSDNLVGEGKIIDYFVSDKNEIANPERNKWNK